MHDIDQNIRGPSVEDLFKSASSLQIRVSPCNKGPTSCTQLEKIVPEPPRGLGFVMKSTKASYSVYFGSIE